MNKTLEHRQERKKILVVDDDLLMRKSMAVIIRGLGFDVMQAENGKEGINTFHREKPDLMLLDLRMPVMDGIEVLEALQEELKDTPVIIVSGAGGMEDAVKTIKLGAWDYIIKPIEDIDILEHSIYRALDRASLIAENKRYQNYLEDEIRTRTAELHQAQKMEAIGTLAGGIAHDFNNLLTIMNGYSQMAMEQLPGESQAYQDLERVLLAGKRATELVKQILAFSRQSELEARHVQVQFIIKESLKLLRASFPATIEIQSAIDTGCPSIMADPTEIHQVFMNLCTNAKQSMLQKGGILRIELTRHEQLPENFNMQSDIPRKKQYIQLTVADTGEGIPEENLHRIFDPFFSSKPVGQGTGLGLSVVHGIVMKLNGDIQVTSKHGQGAVFRIIFPTAEVETPSIAFDTAPLPTGRERIMVVDDDLEIAQIIERILSKLGYRVNSFSSSLEALDDFSKSPDAYDLVITDMTMPGITGKELSISILEQRPDMPIVMCTGFSETLDKKQAMEIGIREYIMKPIVKNELAMIVRKVLNHG